MIVCLIFKQLSRREGRFCLVETLLEVNLDFHFIALHHAYVDELHLHLQFKARELPYKSAVNGVLNVLNLLVTRQLGIDGSRHHLEAWGLILFPVVGPVDNDLFEFHGVVRAIGQRLILQILADLRFNLFLDNLPLQLQLLLLIHSIQLLTHNYGQT